MKKIIALAVASAFVAPVMAAEVTLGGHVEYIISSADGADDKFYSNETEVNISASETLDNGITVTATINLIDDDLAEIDTQGTNLTFSGAFGKLEIGDVSGALDATGDYTDVAPTGGSFNGDGQDMAINYVFPVVVPGLVAEISFSPDSADNNPGVGAGIVDEASAFSLTYSFESAKVYYGVEEYKDSSGDNKMTAFGIQYKYGPLTVAAERADLDDAGNDESITGMSVVYKYGAFDFIYEDQRHKNDVGTVDDVMNETVVAVQYNMGPVDLYVAAVDKDEANLAAGAADSTRFGVEYVF